MIIGIIPARIGSTRFPKKILADIKGKPMIAHVLERALKAEKLDKVIIAIDSKETEKALSDYKVEMVMTNPKHESGTDRVAEVAKQIDDAELIINIQGDEPLLDFKIIDGLVSLFEDPTVSMATAVSRKINTKDYFDENVVKVFIDENYNAYDFKRKIHDVDIGAAFRHIGFYGFVRQTLLDFTSYPQSKNEIKYSLEQFRAIDNNIRIRALVTNSSHPAVDIAEDIDKILKIIKKENIRKNKI